MRKFLLNIVLVLSLPLSSVYAQSVELSLEQCIALATDGSVSVKNAELDILAAKAQKQEALAAYFPTVSATAFGFIKF